MRDRIDWKLVKTRLAHLSLRFTTQPRAGTALTSIPEEIFSEGVLDDNGDDDHMGPAVRRLATSAETRAAAAVIRQPQKMQNGDTLPIPGESTPRHTREGNAPPLAGESAPGDTGDGDTPPIVGESAPDCTRESAPGGMCEGDAPPRSRENPPISKCNFEGRPTGANQHVCPVCPAMFKLWDGRRTCPCQCHGKGKHLTPN